MFCFACVRTQAAIPCLEEARGSGDNGHTEVEVEPMSYFNASQAIERLGQQVKSSSLSATLNAPTSLVIVLYYK